MADDDVLLLIKEYDKDGNSLFDKVIPEVTKGCVAVAVA